MLQWVIIGAVIWYFYRRYTTKQERLRRQDPRYIHRQEPSGTSFTTEKNYDPRDDEGDYIDYEEIN